MKFLHRDTERLFVGLHADMLARRLCWCGLASGATSLIVMVCLCLQELSNRSEATWKLNLLAAAACMGISILAAVAATVPCVMNLATPEVLEIVVVVSIFSLAAIQFLLDPWYGSKILQQDPDLVWFASNEYNFSDTRPVLVLSILVVVSHFVLPIRLICLLPLDVALGLMYATFAFLLKGPDGDRAWSTLLLIQGLIICAVVGRRTTEDYQRRTFCMTITRRALRAQSEQSESREGPMTPVGRELSDRPCASEVWSRPSTTPSCAAFDIDKAHRFPSLNKLIELGRKEHWYISSDELKLQPKTLGEGSFGVVIAGEYHGSPVAVKAKKIDLGNSDGLSDEDRLMSLLNEVKIMRRLRHPNIALLHGAHVDATYAEISIVLERVFGTTLEETILKGNQNSEQLQPRDRLRALVDISRALRYLHSRVPAIVHGDLKPTNIFVEQELGLSGIRSAKLLDFGLARALTKHAIRGGGTLLWVAPEVVLCPGRSPHPTADIFSFGRLAVFVLTGTTMLKDTPTQEIIKGIKQRSLPTPPFPTSLEPSLARCWKYVDPCLEFEAHTRPSMELVGSFLETTIEVASSDVTSICTDRQTKGSEREASFVDLSNVAPGKQDVDGQRHLQKCRTEGRSYLPGRCAGGDRARVAPSPAELPTFSSKPVVPGTPPEPGGGDTSSGGTSAPQQSAAPGRHSHHARSRTTPPRPSRGDRASEQSLSVGGLS